ncbi:MAG TPA: orotate phosphoribosyltransferase [Candidatus Omnitrophica bacterium]|nr:MAG: orotate phosphoribosyltransferase [Omnitrophica WOR_2 bacterium GWA2_53_43]HBO97965.1 orotate phosphoribosyltransferase [Candidatus Omnitrophota bacterium]HCI44647.1 orotate phosphoribosyltransferase [Candidatus Omnitrophota bacterium]
MIELGKERRELLELLARDAYVRGKVILSSGKESDYYVDARRVTLTAKGAYLCARLILDQVKDDPYDAIGGPTLGADPMLGAIGVVSLQAGRPVSTFIIRKAPKAHGKQQQVEGPELRKGGRVILIDDVATTGKAFLESLDVLTPMGISVVKAVCVLDRNEGAKQALAQKGVPLVALFSISEIHK